MSDHNLYLKGSPTYSSLYYRYGSTMSRESAELWVAHNGIEIEFDEWATLTAGNRVAILPLLMLAGY